MESRIQSMVNYRFRNYMHLSLQHQKKLFPLLVRVIPNLRILLEQEQLWIENKELGRFALDFGMRQITGQISRLANGAREDEIIARMESLTEEEMLDLYKLLQEYVKVGPVIIREIQQCLFRVMERRINDLEYANAKMVKNNKKKESLRKICAAVLGIVLLLMLFGPKKEVPYSDDLKVGSDVFAELVSVNPISVSVTKSGKSSMAVTIVQGVFCSGKTTSGETIVLYIPVKDYETYFDSKASFDNPLLATADPITFPSPVRVHGFVQKWKQLNIHAPETSKILHFESMES